VTRPIATTQDRVRAALRAVPDQPRRGIRYLRQSTEKEETISDAIQLAACDDYMTRHGIVPVGEPIWEQHTGRVWHKRQGVQRAMKAIADGDADVIVVWKWNRLSRLRKHWVLAEVAIEELGGAVESATEPADLTTSHGRFSRNLMIDLAELQSDLIGDSWRDTHETRRRRGLPASGGDRYGYRRVREPGEPERYDPIPEQAEVLEWLYAQYIGGRGFNSIARDANRAGVPGINGSKWTESGLAALLDSGFGAGLLARYGELKGGKSLRPSFPNRVWNQGAHEPVLKDGVWDRYKNERLHRRKEQARNITPAHELAGIIKCGLPLEGDEICGAAMHRSYSGPNPTFVCGAWKKGGSSKFVGTTQRRVRLALHKWLGSIADDIEHAAERTEGVQLGKLHARVDAELIMNEVLAIDRKLDRATRQNIEEIIPTDTYKRVRDELLAERAAVEERLAIAQRAAEVPAVSPVQVATDLLSEWDTLAVDRRRDMLRHLVKRILVVPSGRQGKGATIVIEPT
jgi:DNA invertase Pin-like site-specific DNA recombinase